MLHYDPQHVSSSTLLILRRTNCITTASGIVTLCKQSPSVNSRTVCRYSVFCMKWVPSTALFTTHINKSVIFPRMRMKEMINPASEQNTKGKNVSVCGDGREKNTF